MSTSPPTNAVLEATLKQKNLQCEFQRQALDVISGEVKVLRTSNAALLIKIASLEENAAQCANNLEAVERALMVAQADKAALAFELDVANRTLAGLQVEISAAQEDEALGSVDVAHRTFAGLEAEISAALEDEALVPVQKDDALEKAAVAVFSTKVALKLAAGVYAALPSTEVAQSTASSSTAATVTGATAESAAAPDQPGTA